MVSDLRSGLDEMPVVPGKRGMRDRLFHPRPTGVPAGADTGGAHQPRMPGWLSGWRQNQQARLAARSRPSADSWSMPAIEDEVGGAFGVPEPMYDGGWQAHAPSAGGAWGHSAAPAAPPPPSPQNQRSAPAPHAAPPYAAPPSPGWQSAAGLDSRYDTGQGWSIVSSAVQDDPARSFVRMNAVYRGRGHVAARVAAEVSRLTFNTLLLGIILTILAIPTMIGLARVSSVLIPVSRHVATPTPRPIPTPYQGYQTFRASTYSIAYPSDWKAANTTPVLRIGGSIQEEVFSGAAGQALAVATHASFPQDQLINVLEAMAAAFSQGSAANFQVVVTPRAGPVVDGQTWLWEQFTFDLTTGQRTTAMEGVAMVANKGVNTYLLLYLAPTAQFSALKAQYFDPMVASFRFGA